VIYIFYIFAVLLILLSFRSFRGGIGYLRYFKRELSRPLGSYQPFATVVIPCKGIDDGLAENLTAVLKQASGHDKAEVYQRVKNEYETRFGLTLGPALGFNDTFAMEIRGEDARRMNVKTLSQAAGLAPQWRAGFGYEFMERPDGYQGLVATYGLHFLEEPRIMDLGLLARALKDHQIDFAGGNATDGLIPALDLSVLEDDRHYFPPYEAVPVVRKQTEQLHPAIGQALASLGEQISDAEMRQMNYAVDGQHRDTVDVVREFLKMKKLIP